MMVEERNCVADTEFFFLTRFVWVLTKLPFIKRWNSKITLPHGGCTRVCCQLSVFTYQDSWGKYVGYTKHKTKPTIFEVNESMSYFECQLHGSLWASTLTVEGSITATPLTSRKGRFFCSRRRYQNRSFDNYWRRKNGSTMINRRNQSLSFAYPSEWYTTQQRGRISRRKWLIQSSFQSL